MEPVGCKVRWRGVCMVNETMDMVDELILVHVCFGLYSEFIDVNIMY